MRWLTPQWTIQSSGFKIWLWTRIGSKMCKVHWAHLNKSSVLVSDLLNSSHSWLGTLRTAIPLVYFKHHQYFCYKKYGVFFLYSLLIMLQVFIKEATCHYLSASFLYLTFPLKQLSSSDPYFCLFAGYFCTYIQCVNHECSSLHFS